MNAIDLRNRAFALREDQDMEAAWGLIAEAAKLLPNDPQTLFAHAQIAFETGRPPLMLPSGKWKRPPRNWKPFWLPSPNG
jgi:hypothetical protein